MEDYLKAHALGERAFRKAVLQGNNPYIEALQDSTAEPVSSDSLMLGIMDIPLDQIAGTVTRSRQISFACNFMPIMDRSSEFALKWSNVYDYQIEEGISDPVKVYEYLHRFYVLEGNKRVSVRKYLQLPSVTAEVIRLMPEETDPLYSEFLQFFKATGLYIIDFSAKGSYLKLCRLLNHSISEPWSRDDIQSLKSCFYYFDKAFNDKGFARYGISVSDAFLMYLSVYEMNSLYSSDLINKNLSVLESELQAASAGHDISMTDEEGHSLRHTIKRILPFIPANAVRAAFLYESSPEQSSREFDHELGRIMLENRRLSNIISTRYDNCRGENFDFMMQQAADNNDVIFTVSANRFNDTFRYALKYPDKIFLNCSGYPGRNALRTYSVRMYEAHFLLGFIAGTLCEDHRMAYIADYPFYGTIAAINAFAIGASMSDPECTVYLDWQQSLDREWKQQMADLGIQFFCGPSLPDFAADNTEYGLYMIDENREIINLAAPVIHWEEYYEKLLKMISEGTYRSLSNKDKAVSYRWGMKNGVLDINVSGRLSYSLHNMIQMLKEGIIQDSVNPFRGELRSSDGQIWETSGLSIEEIYEMNWLNRNIVGIIPPASQLNEEVRTITEESGITL